MEIKHIGNKIYKYKYYTHSQAGIEPTAITQKAWAYKHR